MLVWVNDDIFYISFNFLFSYFSQTKILEYQVCRLLFSRDFLAVMCKKSNNCYRIFKDNNLSRCFLKLYQCYQILYYY